MAIFKQENGSDKVKSIFNKVQTGQATVYMNIINLIEIYYLFYREVGKNSADLILKKIYTMPIQFIETIDDVLFSETSRIKATYAIPLGDAIGLATAIKFGGSFVTGDHSDIEKIEKAEPVSVFWFR